MPKKGDEKVVSAQLEELLQQALETELGGVKVYETALRCAVNEDLSSELEDYLEQTKQHVTIVRELMERLGFDPDAEGPGRGIVRQKGEGLVDAMETALDAGGPEGMPQLVAVECLVEAETKDHLNWELLGELADALSGAAARALKEAHERVEEEEDEHLYHLTGWARELWMESLGLPAVLPPPEEQKHVKTAIGAARAKQSREEMT